MFYLCLWEFVIFNKKILKGIHISNLCNFHIKRCYFGYEFRRNSMSNFHQNKLPKNMEILVKRASSARQKGVLSFWNENTSNIWTKHRKILKYLKSFKHRRPPLLHPTPRGGSGMVHWAEACLCGVKCFLCNHGFGFNSTVRHLWQAPSTQNN